MNVAIDQLEIDHARFNAAKTLSTTTRSEFEHTQIGQLQVTRDRSRADSYYNRVLGLTTESLPELNGALAWIYEGVPGQTVRLDIPDDHGLGRALGDRGFVPTDSLVWLRAAPSGQQPGADSAPLAAAVRALTTDDWGALRQLLTAHGPITDEIWLAKRRYLCTDTFRWVGIVEGDELVSAASTWISDGAAILGSAYTRPAWRGRGYQRQLLDYRRQAAATDLVVDVAPESTSYRNCIRAGFVELDRRHIWEVHAG